MLAIARDLMSKPKLLMLDEPSLGLMPKLVSEVLEIVKELGEHGNTILLVEQNIQETLKLADLPIFYRLVKLFLKELGKKFLRVIL